MTKTQIDQLGARLRKGNVSEADLRLLDAYRLSFEQAYRHVIGIIRETLKLEPTGRPAKSTTSIVDKLKRESIRLTQMQDIAGCRVIVEDIESQEKTVAELGRVFANVSVVDRREMPSHGYRAVHVIVKAEEKYVEVQVRTTLQHLWAELSEKLSDVYNQTIKYGGGSDAIRSVLLTSSQIYADFESMERQLVKPPNVESLGPEAKWTEHIRETKIRAMQMLRQLIELLERQKK
jgi:putative GTP pyrophosphokinase